jgi:hypothetical protein
MNSIQPFPGVTIKVSDETAVSATDGDSIRKAHEDDESGFSIDAIIRKSCEKSAKVENPAFNFVGAMTVHPPVAEMRGAAAGDKSTESILEVEVANDETSLILIEQDGIYHWQQPDESSDTQKETFTIRPDTKLLSDENPDGDEMRGFLKEFILDRLKIYLFRRTAKKTVPTIINFVERNVVECGRCLFEDYDGHFVWRYTPDLSVVDADSSKPVLLLVHGTASSTSGSFGALRGSEEGRAFLKKACQKYRLIVGYDHRTLTRDPKENAGHLLEYLKSADWSSPSTHIDCIAFSRGALVLRTLLQQLIPADDWSPAIGKCIFVGCTNSGTLLAEPERLGDTLDLYTNLVLGGARVMHLMGLTGVAKFTSSSMRILQGLAEAIVEEGVTHESAPGLAAMSPTGPFLAELNSLDSDVSQYHAITSDFEPAEGPPPRPAWSKRLKISLLDKMADGHFDEENDLVVHQRSMTRVHPTKDLPFKEVFDFKPSAGVFHTIYFAQPETVGKLTTWLEL